MKLRHIIIAIFIGAMISMSTLTVAWPSSGQLPNNCIQKQNEKPVAGSFYDRGWPIGYLEIQSCNQWTEEYKFKLSAPAFILNTGIYSSLAWALMYARKKN